MNEVTQPELLTYMSKVWAERAVSYCISDLQHLATTGMPGLNALTFPELVSKYAERFCLPEDAESQLMDRRVIHTVFAAWEGVTP